MRTAVISDDIRPTAEAAQDSKGSRTRKRLLDATAAEVARCGVAGTSINAIAAAAGLKTGSIYFHFESKDRLVEAMLEEGLLASLAYLDAALAAVPDHANAAARLGAAIRAHATAVHELSNYTVAVLAPTFPSDSAGTTARKLRRSYVSRWTQLVGDAQSAGVLAREPDPRLLRDLIFGALNAVSLAGRPSGDTADALRALLGLAQDPRSDKQAR
jgi:TetR/AcrR family transcriptional regulator, cholesterol catabolism regulator